MELFKGQSLLEFTERFKTDKEEGKQGRSYDTKKKKVLCAMELTDRGKVKRFYALKIPDFSSKKQLIL